MPGVSFFLSEQLSQDPLERFFGTQRQRGRAHENPNVQEFHKNTQALRVIDLFCTDPVKGNCCKRKISYASQIDLDKENFPRPKRKKVIVSISCNHN